MKKFIVITSLLLVSLFFISDSFAEVTFDYGAALRVRQEIWDNLLDLKTLNPVTPDINFFRFKLSLWGSATYNKDTSLFLKLTAEPYIWIGPLKPKSSDTETTSLDENEGVIDNLYIKANKVFGLPVDLKIGRQDFWGSPEDMYGEGFLFSDGTPQDGSRTFYFNAARVRWHVNNKNKVDFVYISNQFQDKYLPTWRTQIENGLTYYDGKKYLDTSDSQAFVIYGRTKPIDNLDLEPYYIWKKEEEGAIPLYSAPAVIPELNLNTIGARAVYTSAPWTFGGEFAYQFGEYDGHKGTSQYAGQDRRGYGGYIFGKYKFENTRFKPELELRYVYLSGDDPDTSKNEDFDPLYSRQPYWNELLGYVMINEFIREAAKIAFYWSNSQLFMAKVKMALTPDTSLSLSYQYWMANEVAQPIPSRAAMFGKGDERGHLPTIFLTHKFNKNIDAFLQYEYFVPGDFYADKAKNGQFLRWQIQFKI